MKEHDIKILIRDYLKLQGFFTFPILQSFGCYLGIPDRIAIKKGYVFFIEVKSEKGHLSEHQIKFRDDLLSQDGPFIKHIVARSVEDVADIVKECGLEDQKVLF